MKRIIMIVALLSSIASAVDASGWYAISELEYFMLSSDMEDSGADPSRFHFDIEFRSSSDILKCVFSFTTGDTNYPAHWMTDQRAFFYIEAPGDFLYFNVIDQDINIPHEMYSDSIPTDSLKAGETNTITFQDGSTLTFYLEHVVNPYIYW